MTKADYARKLKGIKKGLNIRRLAEEYYQNTNFDVIWHGNISPLTMCIYVCGENAFYLFLDVNDNDKRPLKLMQS